MGTAARRDGLYGIEDQGHGPLPPAPFVVVKVKLPLQATACLLDPVYRIADARRLSYAPDKPDIESSAPHLND